MLGQSGGPLNLSGSIFVVPTRQVGRRLRENQATEAATYQQGAFPPHEGKARGIG